MIDKLIFDKRDSAAKYIYSVYILSIYVANIAQPCVKKYTFRPLCPLLVRAKLYLNNC